MSKKKSVANVDSSIGQKPKPGDGGMDSRPDEVSEVAREHCSDESGKSAVTLSKASLIGEEQVDI
jgi:hypothetical protein